MLPPNNHWTQFAARSYGVKKTDESSRRPSLKSSVKPSHVKQLGGTQARYSGRLRRSPEEDKEYKDETHVKSWDEIEAEIQARIAQDSEIENFGGKIVDERSAAYPHQAIIDGYFH